VSTASSSQSEMTRMSSPELDRSVMFSLKASRVITNVLVFLNSIFIGIQVQINVARAREGLPESQWVFQVDVFFAVAFVLEFMWRVAVLRRRLWGKGERVWTLFEVALILTSVFELVVPVYDVSLLRAVRVLKVARHLRGARRVKHWHELRLILASMLSSVRTLAWAGIFLSSVLYSVAVFIMMDVEAHVRTSPNVDELLLDLYGTVQASMLSLFMAITGGNDWEYLMRPLQTMNHYFYMLFFVLFVFITIFGIMNVLTAIYCNAASCVQAVDRELVILEQTEESSVVEGELRALFQVCSTNGNLDLKTLRSQLANPLIVDLLRFMEVEINNVAGLFKMLDVRGDGCVGVEEFVVGMMRLRGTARSMDMTLMMQQQVELCTQVSALASFTAQNFEALRGVENRGTVDRIEDLKEHDVAKHRANAERSFARKELLMKERGRSFR